MNPRISAILDSLFLLDLSISELLFRVVQSTKIEISEQTLLRDLQILISEKKVKKVVVGKATKYKIDDIFKIIYEINSNIVSNYFKDENRSAVRYNFEILNQLRTCKIFEDSEISELNSLSTNFRNNFINSKLSNSLFQKEIERLTIELSWKSSVIEGNTYSLIETESLLKEGIKAEGKSDRQKLIKVLIK